MNTNKIIVETFVASERKKVWEYYTSPDHIVNWNFASEDWCCPIAENDLKIGEIYKARMEAKDGSFGFDFEAVYSKLQPLESFTYGFEDRTVNVQFKELGDETQVVFEFDPESQNPIEMQKMVGKLF